MFFSRLAVLSISIATVTLSLTQAQPPATSALTILQTLEGHKELVYSLSHSPDGKHLLSGSFDKSLKLWDLSTNKEARTYAGGSGHNDLVLTTAINPDGRVLASGAKDNSIKLWDMPVSGALLDYQGSTAAVTTEAVTVDGSKLATGQVDGVIRLWNTSDGKQLAELKDVKKSITAMVISVNGQWLAVGDVDGQVYLFSLADSKLAGSTTAHTKSVTGLAFHANNQLLYSVGKDGLLKGWNIPLGAASTPYKLDKTTAIAVSRAQDGRMAIACADKTIRVLKNDGTLEKALPAASSEIKCLCLHNTTVIASLADGKVAWWDVAAGTLTHQIDLGKPANSITLRGDGNEFAVSLPDGSIKIGEVTKDKAKGADKVITKTIPGTGTVIAQFHSSDVNILAIADDKKTLKTWLIKENKADQTITLDAPATHITWSKDASRIAAACGNQLIVVNPKDGKVITKIAHTSPVISCGFGAETNRLISTTQDGNAHLFDVGNGKELQTYTGHSALLAGLNADVKKLTIAGKSSVTVAPITISKLIAGPHPIRGFALMDGGNRAVTVSDDGVGRIYNLGNTNMDKELKGHTGAILAVATLANSQVVFTAGSDNSLRCFNANDGKELKVLPLPAVSQTLAVQGNMLVAGCADSSVVVMNVPYTPGQAIGEGFGKVLYTFKQSGPVTGVIMPGVTSTIFSCSDDKSIKSWKIAGDIPLRNLLGHGNLVDAVSFSPDGHTLASSSHDGTIRLWNPHDGKPMGEVKLAPQPLYCLAWRGDGKQLAVGSFDRTIRFINVADKKIEREIKPFDDKSSPNGHSDAVYSVAYASNDQLYSAGADGKIKLWNVNDGGMVKTFVDPALKDRAQRDFINNIRLTKDGKKLVAVGNGGWVTIWNTTDGKLLHSQKLPVYLYGLSIHPDGNSFATGNMNGTIYVIKMP